jgi:hypothetical protein
MTASRALFVTALLAVIVVLPAVLVMAEAGEVEGRKNSARGQNGHILWQRCKDGPANETGWTSCKYFVGVGREMFIITSRIILDPSDKLCFTGRFNDGADARILTDYLRDHPEERGGKAMEIYFKAFRERYRCRVAPAANPNK